MVPLKRKNIIIVIGAENHPGLYDVQRFKSQENKIYIFAGYDSLQQQTPQTRLTPGVKIDFNRPMPRQTMNRFRRLVGANPVHVIFDRSTMKYVENIPVFIQWLSTLIDVLSDNLQVLLMPVCTSSGYATHVYITGISRNKQDEFYGRYQLTHKIQNKKKSPGNIYLYQDGIHVDNDKLQLSLALNDNLDHDIREFLQPMIDVFNTTGQNRWKIKEIKQIIKDQLRLPHGFSMHFLREMTYGKQIQKRYGLDVYGEYPLTLEIKKISAQKSRLDSK